MATEKNTALWVWVCLIVGVCIAALLCGCVLSCFGGGVVDTQTEAVVVWCVVCDGYTLTQTGTIGDVVVCGVCDSILAW